MVIPLVALAGCQKSPSGNKTESVVAGEDVQCDKGSKFPSNPVADAQKAFSERKTKLFAATGTANGFSIFWGFNSLNDAKISPAIKSKIDRYGYFNLPLPDTCPENGMIYAEVLPRYNSEILRLIESYEAKAR